MPDHSGEPSTWRGLEPDWRERLGFPERRPAGSPGPGTLGCIEMNQRRKLEWAKANGERGTNIADMADKVALQIYRADITLSEFLQERVIEWYRGVEAHGFPILEFLGMTRDEYAAWVVDDEISDRIQRLQLRPYMLHILRRY